MKARYIFPLIAVALIVLTSCSIHITKREGSNEVVTKTFDATGFDKLTLRCYADVVYTVSDTVSISVTTSEDTMKDLEIMTTADGHLSIGLGNHSTNSFFINTHSPDLTIYISGPSLQEIMVTGSGTFKCDDVMDTESMAMSVTGSGNLVVNEIHANDLNVSVSGSGDIKFSGKEIKNTIIAIIGSGDIDAHLESCGDVNASISGSGDIKLTGNAKSLNQNVSGSGDIDINGLKIGE